MDVGTVYTVKKAKGLITLAKVGNSFVASIKRFSKDDGTELSPEIVSVDESKLQNQKSKLQGQISAIDELIADLQAL